MPDKLLKKFIYLVTNVMEGYTVALFIRDEKKEKGLKLRCYVSFCKDINEECYIQPGEGLIGWVYREQKPVVANNFERDTSTLKIYNKNENIKSFLAVPLPDEKGVFCVDSKKNYIFTEKKEKIFNQFSFFISHLIENEHLKKDKNNIIKLLELFLFIDDLIYNYRNPNYFLFEVFKLIKENINTKLIIFYFKNKNKIYIFINDELNIYSNIDFSNEKNIINFTIKKQNTICRNNIKESSNYRIKINKIIIDNLSNYLSIPVFIKHKNKAACFFLCKNSKNHWTTDEVRILERIAGKILHYMCDKNG